MNVQIKQIGRKSEECVYIECVEVTPDIENIRTYVLTIGTTLSGRVDDSFYQFNLSEVFYFEAVDEQVLAYTKDRVYELRIRLYKLESAFAEQFFVRCSKSYIINLMKLESISPALNGRFMANMKNGDHLIISRQYVQQVRLAVLGGEPYGF
ncbi:LytTR family DNA-binding domain-containing protein [Sphaerochaeta sp. PS]|uniref:LytTR family DNA-binding domain-containing protein n=1 Tax=Sphaerochaeta sp. PS TaxID=3076336 RepID=UPI0028A455ED|nr:LytTR family DNA-binding domain-containing protein [Sphaerochaeta sp. PS]MDT4761456.1 LytTR family DNA-binding domain-containing protein [Sphaerochaeta sp. PS]